MQQARFCSIDQGVKMGYLRKMQGKKLSILTKPWKSVIFRVRLSLIDLHLFFRQHLFQEGVVRKLDLFLVKSGVEGGPYTRIFPKSISS